MAIALPFRPRTVIVFGTPEEFLGGVADSVTFDATPQIDTTDEVQITQHPVEKGIDITDHIRALPTALVLNGMISDSPIVFAAALLADTDRVEKAHYLLLQKMKSGAECFVVTTRRLFLSMRLKSVSSLRTAKTGDSLPFTVRLQEVKTVEAVADELGDNVAGTTDVGSSPTSDAGQPSTNNLDSMLSELTGYGAFPP